MNVLRTLWLTVVFIWACLSVKSQETKSLLWEINGNGLKTPSYLFGTIHLICPEDIVMGEEVRQAFASTDILFLELDFDDPVMMADLQSQMMLPEGKSLKEYISEADYFLLDKFFKEKMGLGMDVLARMKPMAVISMSMMFMVSCKPQSYEEVFSQMAKNQGKEVTGLETVSYQMGLFDSIPYEKQMILISDMIRDPEKSAREFDDLIKLYKDQDVNTLYDMMDTSSFNFRDYDELLLNNRNRNWIPILEANMKLQSVFAAFGVAHLAGETGVLELLRNKGYEVKPVRL